MKMLYKEVSYLEMVKKGETSRMATGAWVSSLGVGSTINMVAVYESLSWMGILVGVHETISVVRRYRNLG